MTENDLKPFWHFLIVFKTKLFDTYKNQNEGVIEQRRMFLYHKCTNPITKRILNPIRESLKFICRLKNEI